MVLGFILANFQASNDNPPFFCCLVSANSEKGIKMEVKNQL